MGNCSVRDFGAVGDGVTPDTQNIQRAIDACWQDGGGTVTIPAGHYLSGSIRLKSNVRLFLDAGAVLLASTHPTDFKVDADYVDSKTGYFIGAVDAENISVAGYGEIFGRGDLQMERDDGVSEYPLLPAEMRFQMCYFRGCRNVRLEDVTLRQSSEWTVHLIGCRHVVIHAIHILNNRRGANNDGIDPDACQDVRISECHIEGGDDAIVIKATRNAALQYGGCENIVVSGCTLISRGSAVKIGTETFGPIRDCVVTGCVIRQSNRGVGIWVRDGGIVENILIANLVIETRMFRGAPHRDRVRDWWGKGEPIFLSAACRQPGRFPGKIRRVRVCHILAECENSVFLQGTAESPLEDICLEGLQMRFRMVSGLEGGWFDIQPPEDQVFAHDNPAIYGNHVRGLTVWDVVVSWAAPESKHWSHLVQCENAVNLWLDGISGQAARPGLPVVALKNVRGVRLDCCPESEKSTYLACSHVEKAWQSLPSPDGGPAA